jgi:hypothetical protein
MNHLEWTEAGKHDFMTLNGHYGNWEGARCFIIDWSEQSKGYTGPRWQIKSNLPGFRKDLPLQHSVEDAKAFCERMLTRWVAKRGLLFKKHIIVSDAMMKAGYEALGDYTGGLVIDGDNIVMTNERMKMLIEAALNAREGAK